MEGEKNSLRHAEVISMDSRKILVILVMVAVLMVGVSCALLQPPSVDVGMQGAIAVVTQEVLPDAVPEGAAYLCLRLDDPLPPGSVIEEGGPTGRAGALCTVAPKALTTGEESYLFFLDLAPGRYFEHAVKYIVVGGNGGYQVLDARWWPKVNGSVPEPFSKAVPDPEHVIAGNVTLEEPSGLLMHFDFDLVRRIREGFIVVQGLMPSENLYSDANATYLNGIAFFNAYKSGNSEVEGLVQNQAANVLDEIDDMVANKMSPITIYIIAHGGVDGISLGGQWFTAQQFHDKMAEHPSTLFNFLLGSCHSGSFLDNLNTLSNVRVVKTACAADEGAAPDWDTAGGLTDHNAEDTGSEWTSSILRAAELIVDSSDRWAQIQSLASTYSVPVTCVLLDVAGHGALGNYSSLGLTEDLDLTHRVGETTPQSYRSWLVLIPLIPIVPLL